MRTFHSLPALLLLGLTAHSTGQDSPTDSLQERVRALEARLAELESRLAGVEARLRTGAPLVEGATDDRSPEPFRLVGWAPAGAGAASALTDARPDLDRALSWLAKQQSADGQWTTTTGRDVAVTSTALLAFLGNGHTHRFGPFKSVVNRGLQWLKGAQARDGWLGAPGDSLATLDHALATMALCEAYAVSRDFTLRDKAQRAVDALLSVRRSDGGFGFARPRAASNTLCTVHGILALKTAKTAGLEVSDEVLQELAAFLDTATAPDGRTGLFVPGDAASVTLGDPATAPNVPLFTAGAAIGHAFAGRAHGDGRIASLLKHLTVPDPLRPEPAYWYLGSYASLQAGGPVWDIWEPAMLASVHALQGDDGSFRSAGLWGTLGGDVGTTAECALTIELHLRHERASGH